MSVSKVKSVQANGTYESSYGLLYKFDYELEDGKSLSANHKTASPLDVGSDIEYEIKGNSNSGPYGSIKKWSPQSDQYSGIHAPGKDKVQEYIIRQSSLTRAIEHLSYKNHDEMTKENITALAEYYVHYVLHGHV